MKFKQSMSQNQRIERITISHLVVGIDIAKETHVARAVNFRGIEQGRGISFSNNEAGFRKLLNWVRSLQTKYKLQAVIMGMESTGHYWFNLADWLLEQSVEVVLVNPLTTKRNKENRDNCQSKSDAKDALVIADVVSRGYYSELRTQDAFYKRLRHTVNEREYWSDLRANVSNRIVRWLDIHYPEFTTFFKEWDCPRGIATLKSFPLPSDLHSLTAEQVVDGWRKAGMQRAGGRLGLCKAVELMHLAHTTVGARETAEQARREIIRLLDEYERLTKRLEEMGQELSVLLQEIPQTMNLLSTIKGLSPLYIAVILANAGDLKRYAHGRQLMSLAGLNLAESTSGKKKGQIVISKRGRRQLRKYLYLAVIGLVANNPAFKQWHETNVQVKKMKKMRSIFKLIGKLARILVAMAHSGEAFQGEKAVALKVAA
ncbi:IS110 family transposase [Paenibacillus sp. Soil787]|uniref:IS110 family transposase n=1 Tax=Paenibacillus sp. Soil787 TaxID=1736411 RepID=UPI0007002DDD|nr:IS110 family transposase [Paenibacillus sp. Soil787]KRF43890.1 transposase [Paenibacillus sp. Soil787]